VRYPEKVGRLVAASAFIRRSALYPEILAQQNQMSAAPFLKNTPMYEHYQRVRRAQRTFPGCPQGDRTAARSGRTVTAAPASPPLQSRVGAPAIAGS
jgi:hypothetical protein